MSVTSPYNPASGGGRNGAPAGPATASGPPPAVAGDRLPRPPRRRRPGFAALAVLLVVGAAAAAGLLAIQLDARQPVLVARDDIPVGQKIEKGDLAIARVSASNLRMIPAADVDSVVGRYATQTIPGGRLIDGSMLGDQAILRPGRVAMGIPIKAGNVPASGVQPGDRVKILRRTDDGAGELLVADAEVSSVSGDAKRGTFGSGAGAQVATVVFEDDNDGTASKRVASAALDGDAVLALTKRDGS
jgi:Flp pilus assembly protein CpaB